MRYLTILVLLLAGCSYDLSPLQPEDAETSLGEDAQAPDSGIWVEEDADIQEDAGQIFTDSGNVVPDSGQDAGFPEEDSGSPSEDAGADAGPPPVDSGPDMGEFGDWCTDSSQCASGLCDVINNFCTRDCSFDRWCPASYVCIDIPGTSPLRATCRR